MKAVEEGDISLLEEPNDSAFQSLHPLGLGRAKVFRINSSLLCHLLVHLLSKSAQLVALCLVIDVLLFHDSLLA